MNFEAAKLKLGHTHSYELVKDTGDAPITPPIHHYHYSSHCSKKVEKDIRLKHFIQLLKFTARLLAFSCSGVVIGLSATAFHIFLRTKDKPPIQGFAPWPEHTILWPPILVLTVATLSMITSTAIMAAYFFGGHKKAERIAITSTIVTALAWVAGICIWATSGGAMQSAKSRSRGMDFWGWACSKNNQRYEIWNDWVDYDLVCELQNWNFICTFISVGAETLSLSVYAFAVWRLYVKSRLKALNSTDFGMKFGG